MYIYIYSLHGSHVNEKRIRASLVRSKICPDPCWRGLRKRKQEKVWKFKKRRRGCFGCFRGVVGMFRESSGVFRACSRFYRDPNSENWRGYYRWLAFFDALLCCRTSCYLGDIHTIEATCTHSSSDHFNTELGTCNKRSGIDSWWALNNSIHRALQKKALFFRRGATYILLLVLFLLKRRNTKINSYLK